jgi:hypothetical protein
MAAADEGADWSLVNFAKQVFGAKSAAPEVGFNFVEPPPPVEEKAASAAAEIEQPAVPETDPAPKPEQAEGAEDPSSVAEDPIAVAEAPTTVAEAPAIAVTETQDVPVADAVQGVGEAKRQLRTASEMADIIMNALRAVDGVPERGFIITVYGARPWNAMLTIKPEAGRVKDVRLWRQRVQDIGARLRRDFDLIDEG